MCGQIRNGISGPLNYSRFRYPCMLAHGICVLLMHGINYERDTTFPGCENLDIPGAAYAAHVF